MQAPDVTLSAQSARVSSDRFETGSEDDFRKRRARPKHRPVQNFLQNIIPARLARFVTRCGGFALCLTALLGAVALSTWNISDPSLTFANGSETKNWLGFWGASFADIAMQFFGFASIALLLPPLVWGLFRISHRPLSRLGNRLGFWAGSLAFLTAALGCISMPDGWPLAVGLGGVVGDAVLSVPRAFTGDYPGGLFAGVLFALLAAPGIWMMLRACSVHQGIPARIEMADQKPSVDVYRDGDIDPDVQDEESGRDWGAMIAAPLGLLMHWGYSGSAMIRKIRAKRRERAAMQTFPATSDVRTVAEPNFDDAPISESIDDHQPDFDDAGFEVNDAAAFEHGQSIVAAPGTEDPVPHTDAAQSAPSAPRKSHRAKAKPAGGKFVLPSLELLSEQTSIIDDPSLSTDALQENARLLEGVLEDFGVKGQIIKVRPGPVVTLYELEPAPGVKSSRVIGLAEDIARSMSAIAARVAVVPGRNAIGIELPNKRRETVYLREQLSSGEFKKTKAKLAMCLGKTIGGEPVIADLAKMPHLLVAGTTGSGKSVAINTMILSLLYRLGPDKCKLIMIDPKMLELSIYDGIPHLLTPVVVDPKKAVVALKWTVREMEERYKKMSKVGVRNIDGFNTRVADAQAKGEVITRTVQTGFDRETGEAIYEHEELDLEPMPFIVVIIDEMADLMMVAGKDIEGTVQRLAQMARAAGIHVIMATQRPSTDVITGTIKANFPTRISFQVTSKIDSRVMLGESGAEQLLGMGDMLYMAGGGRITRVHGPFVDDQEVEDIVNHLKAQGVPQYLEAVTEETEEDEVSEAGASGGGMGDSDDPYDQAVAIVLRDRKASTSYIQRRLSIGYNRAASLIERMEQEGLISPANHAGKREILVPAEDETI